MYIKNIYISLSLYHSTAPYTSDAVFLSFSHDGLFPLSHYMSQTLSEVSLLPLDASHVGLHRRRGQRRHRGDRAEPGIPFQSYSERTGPPKTVSYGLSCLLFHG